MGFTMLSCAPAQRAQGGKGSAIPVFLTALIVACAVSSAMGQSPSFPDFSSPTNLTVNGNAVVPFNTGTQQAPVNVLRLNPDVQSQVGSAWFNVKQPVAGGFTTTFTFQITHAGFPADGLAFVIHNELPDGPTYGGTAAIGGGGGGIGYDGIYNSLAVEFDTYLNAGPGPNNDPNANHVAIQSCGTNANSADHGATYNDGTASCQLAMNSSLALPVEGFINLSDGARHTATVSYTPPSLGCEVCSGVMNVTLDGVLLFPDGVSVNLSSLLSLDNGTAWVGFTGATGYYSENNDILNWVFTSYSTQTITQPAPANQFTTFNFGSYLYKVKPNQSVDALSVTEVPTNPATFNPGPNFPGATCIIYDSTGGQCIEFHVVCNSPSNNACSNVSYDAVTSYDVPPGSPAITNPGFLKATGQDCTAPTFDTNIITQFFQTRTDPTTKGSSKPSFSCFVAVQNVTYQPADLDILNLAAGKVKPNANLTYVATVGNFGPSGAQGVAISHPIPSGTTYVNSALCTLANGCSNATCSFDGSVASCLVGNLDKLGLEFMVTTVKVTAPAGSVISDTASVTSFNPDPDKVPDRSSTWKTLVSSK